MQKVRTQGTRSRKQNAPRLANLPLGLASLASGLASFSQFFQWLTRLKANTINRFRIAGLAS